MEELVKNFYNSGTEDDAAIMIRNARCTNNFNTGILLGKYLCRVFPNSRAIIDEYGICLYYAEQYDLSYKLYEHLLSLKLDKSDSINAIFNQHFSIDKIQDAYIGYDEKIVSEVKNNINANCLVTFSITTCKRYDLFEKTINSFLKCCKDIHLIGRWILVDDNSSEEDREKMQRLYPFFEFRMKTPEEKGHANSMNIIRDMVRTPYLFHMEDDWKFFCEKEYIKECIEILSQDDRISQCLVNKNYAETSNEHNILGGDFRTCKYSNLRYYLHEYVCSEEDKKAWREKHGDGPSSSYWPHFSFRPSLIKTRIFNEIGEFNKDAGHFEMDYAYRYVSKGYISAFLEKVHCLHTGRLTSQRDNNEIANAYSLNNEHQFVKPKIQDVENSVAQAQTQAPPPEEKVYSGKIFVVNLDSRKDRIESVDKEFTKCNNLKYNRYSAVDGSRLKSTPQLQIIFDGNDYNMRRGMVGCAMSHIDLYTKLLQSEDSIYVILEDDITLTPNFEDIATKVINDLFNKQEYKDWHLVYLGHHIKDEFMYLEQETGSHRLEKWSAFKSLVTSLGGTIGYIINKRGAELLLNRINKFGMTNCIDTMQQKAADDMNIYYLVPSIVKSECFRGNMDTVDSDIQKNYDSLTVPLQERFEYEMSLYTDIKECTYDEAKEIVSQTGLCQPFYTRDNDKMKIADLCVNCIYPYYTLDNQVLFVCPNSVPSRYFHRFKKDGKWDVTDAIQYVQS